MAALVKIHLTFWMYVGKGGPQHKPVDLITLIFHSLNFALYIANDKRASNVSCESCIILIFLNVYYLAALFIGCSMLDTQSSLHHENS